MADKTEQTHSNGVKTIMGKGWTSNEGMNTATTYGAPNLSAAQRAAMRCL